MTAVYGLSDGKATYQGLTLAEWVPTIVEELVEAAQPQRIILFGSVTRGDDGPDSDIDLMVVLPSLDYDRRREVASRLRSLLRTSAPVQLLITDERECQRRRNVIGSMHYHPWREGRLIYERA